jgi:integral membrane sensor domain MASE1
MEPIRFARRFVTLAIFVLIYVAAGKLGLRLAVINPSASAVWPPTGIALAGLLMLGLSAWPAVFAGAFIVNITTAGTAATVLGIATGNTLEALAGAALVNHYASGRLALERAQGVFKFALFAGMFATAIGATVGVTSLVLGGSANWNDFGAIWRTWWLGDAGGALVVAPLLIAWAASPHLAWDRRKFTEFGIALFTLLLAAGAEFGQWLAITGKDYPFLFLLLPVLVWIAFRFEQRETSIATLVLSIVAVAGTVRGLGPFSSKTDNESLLFLQVFLSTIAIMSMTLTAAVSERRRGEQRLEAQQAAAKILSQSQTLGEAVPRILNAVCEKLHWEVGNFWRIADTGSHLECVETSAENPLNAAEFVAMSKQMTFAPGVGMPGRAWQNQSAVWIEDVLYDSNFPRARFARKAGLHSAFAFPVMTQGRLSGILEFFTGNFEAPERSCWPWPLPLAVRSHNSRNGKRPKKR